jgi:hypothetical protein
MTLHDPILRDLIATLGGPTQRALLAHVLYDVTTGESWALLRWLRRKLKRTVRGKRR